MFGVIRAMYLKYESSQRGRCWYLICRSLTIAKRVKSIITLDYNAPNVGGLHAHGQVCQPFMQAEHLRELMGDGYIFKEQLFGFFEALMCAYFPVPQSHPSPSYPDSSTYIEACPLLPKGACLSSCMSSYAHRFGRDGHHIHSIE